MKILIVNINSKYIHSSLSPWYLKSALEEKNQEAEIFEYTINSSKGELVKSILLTNCNTIAFCCYIWNIEFIKSVVFELRGNSKINYMIILGGPEVTYNPNYYIDNYDIDYIICGEGERPLSDLICEIEKNNFYPLIDGVTHKFHDGGIYFDNQTPPSPYSKEYFSALENKIAYIETSRGCPFSCTFCLSGRKERVKYFNLDRVKAEILKLANTKTKTIKFIDRSFNANAEHALQIIKFIKQSHNQNTIKNSQFHFEIAADVLTDEIIEEYCSAEVGLFRLEIGLQSFNTTTLDAISRKTDIEKLKYNISRLTQDKNLHIHVDLIAGLPFENYSSFKKGFNIAYNLGANVIQLGFLKLLKGSPMDKQPKGQFSEKAPYEVISTPWISKEELLQLKGIEEVVDKIYNTNRYKNTIRIALSNFDSPFDLFEAIYINVGAPHGESMFDLSNRLLLFLEKHCEKKGLIAALEKDMQNVNPVGRTPRFIREYKQNIK